MNVRKGIEEIVGLLSELRADKEFFVQFVNIHILVAGAVGIWKTPAVPASSKG